MFRRQFLQSVAATTAAVAICKPNRNAFADHHLSSDLPYKISLAQWSLHRALKGGKMKNTDFPRVAKEEFGIDAVEYVNQFFKDKAKDTKYLSELKGICDGLGVKSLLIMVDGEGQLGAPKDDDRTKSVENHYRWVDAAKALGCHSIRVNAGSNGSYEEQQKLAADGLRRLSEYAAPRGLNVIVENHGGLSSNGQWLASVIKMVDLENCGTLPDFGNFRIGDGKEYDRYKGVDELMPYAKAVSAKTHDFDEQGNDTQTDYEKMMAIVLKHGYHGYVGIEYAGGKIGEKEGIRKSKELLVRVGKKLASTAAKKAG